MLVNNFEENSILYNNSWKANEICFSWLGRILIVIDDGYTSRYYIYTYIYTVYKKIYKMKRVLKSIGLLFFPLPFSLSHFFFHFRHNELSQLPRRFPCIRSYGNPARWPSPWGNMAPEEWKRHSEPALYTFTQFKTIAAVRIIIPSCSTVPGIVIYIYI